MQFELTVRGPDQRDIDIAIIASEPPRLGDVMPLLRSVIEAPEDAGFSVDGVCLGPEERFDGERLRVGCTLVVGSDVPPPEFDDNALWVVAGPDAGRVVGLRPGILRVGRGEDADLRLADDGLSRSHIAVRQHQGEVWLRELGSTNGTSIDGQVVTAKDEVPLPSEATIRIGDSLLQVSTRSTHAAFTHPDGAGRRVVNRMPRLEPASAATVIDFPERHSRGRRPIAAILTAVLPALAGVALAAAMRNWQFLLFSLISPCAMSATVIAERLTGRRGRRSTGAQWKAAEATAAAALAAAVEQEAERRNQLYPDAAVILRAARLPGTRLWERRPAEPVFLALRLGLADLPAECRGRRSGVLLPPPRLDDLPVVATLTRGGLGIVGPPELSAGSARWILCQLLVMHSPAEVSIRIVAGAHARWHWLRWIPHLRSTGTGGAGRPLFDELSDELRRRRQAQASPATVAANPWIVVVVDGLDDPTTLARWSELLCDAHPVRMVGVFVCAHKELLPAAVRMIAACDGSRPSLISLEADGVQTLPGVRADRVGTAYAESLSRGIACLRDAGSRAGGDMPSEVDLFDLYGIRTLCVSSVLDRWSAYAGGATAILGACGSGPLPIDLVRNGPHLLLAGTTGSGKSELLRAFIAGLAISSPPNRLGFVLIDYKGGSAFGDCIGLPHTTALVTDLDRPETERALRSLRAEIRRRERMLAQAGARDIDDYHQTHAAIDSSLARLVIVIDEFAALAVDLPEFIDGLVDIAQRGRSLGIHLVLATQRPNGVVSPQIKSNTDIKIALRVAESAESVDVLGAPHAASISKSTPGRGYALVNSERRYFQAARLGDPPRDDGVRVVVLEDWTTSPTSSNTGRPHQSAANRLDRLSGTTVQSGMSVLCQVMDAAATARDVARPSAPWRPPLPHLLSCGELPVATDETGADAETFDGHGAVHFTESLIAYGLVDVPDEQSQYPIGCDLGDGGVLSFIGSPRSGRSAALRTLLGQAASRLTPDELHCYLIDAVGDITGQVGDLPHVGAAIDLRQPAAVRRLIHLLGRDIDCRRSQLAAGGFASLGRARQAGLMLPYVLLLIDGWDELTAMSERTDSGRSVDCLLGLLRDAAAAGYTVVVTGGRSMLSARVAANVARTHLLNLLNPQDYLVAGLRSRDVPANPPPGRAVIVQSGRHMQVGLLNDDPQPHAQWEAFRRMTANADLSVVPRTMIRLEPLPGPTGLHQVKSRHRIERDTGALIALGGDVPRLLRFDPALDQRFLVIGEPRSGRTNLLLSIAVQSVGRRPVLVVSPLESLLTAWARESGIAVVTGSSAGPDPAALLNDASPGTIVLVDDADQLDDHLDAGAGELCGRRPDLVFVASTRPQPVRMRFTGFVNELRQRRAGILLSPIATDCDLLGVRYPVEGLDCDVPGRGLLTSTEIRSLGFEALGVQTLLATEGDDVQTVSRPMSTSTMEIS